MPNIFVIPESILVHMPIFIRNSPHPKKITFDILDSTSSNIYQDENCDFAPIISQTSPKPISDTSVVGEDDDDDDPAMPH